MTTPDLAARIQHLSDGIQHLTYRFSADFGYDDAALDSLSEDIDARLGGALTITTKDSAHADYTLLNAVDPQILLECEQRVAAIASEMHSHPLYAEAVAAYQVGNQRLLAKLIPRIFTVDPVKKDIKLFHGISMRSVQHGTAGIDYKDESEPVDQWISPADYVDRVLGIREEGLLPSQGNHHNIDDALRAVFCVDKPYDTYGILFFAMNPVREKHAVFDAGYIDGHEHLIYTPRLKVPMTLHVKIGDHLDRMLNHVFKGEAEQAAAEKYAEHVALELSERRVAFSMATYFDTDVDEPELYNEF
ncbi:MAG: hypothetical protein ABIH41_07045 [Nanoarchaeota archaeon]